MWARQRISKNRVYPSLPWKQDIQVVHPSVSGKRTGWRGELYHDVKVLPFVSALSVSEAPQREQGGTGVLHLPARWAAPGDQDAARSHLSGNSERSKAGAEPCWGAGGSHPVTRDAPAPNNLRSPGPG